jgi:hypothetical protein
MAMMTGTLALSKVRSDKSVKNPKNVEKKLQLRTSAQEFDLGYALVFAGLSPGGNR